MCEVQCNKYTYLFIWRERRPLQILFTVSVNAHAGHLLGADLKCRGWFCCFMPAKGSAQNQSINQGEWRRLWLTPRGAHRGSRGWIWESQLRLLIKELLIKWP